MTATEDRTAAFPRVDNAAVIDFLTSTAGILQAHGMVGPKQIDNLRLVLSGIQTERAVATRPVLLELQDQNAEFLTVLESLFGTTRLCRNLYRYSLRSQLIELEKQLAQWGSALCQKAETLFNRPFYVYDGESGLWERTSLVASLVYDLTEEIADSGEQVRQLIDRLSRFLPVDLPETWERYNELNEALRQALGFDAVETRPNLAGLRESTAAARIVTALEAVPPATVETAEQIRRNFARTHHGLIATADRLRAECGRVRALAEPGGRDLTVQESRRVQTAGAISSLTQCVRELGESMNETLSGLDQAQAPRALPRSAIRAVAADLLRQGIAPAEARKAADDLHQFLSQDGIEPQKVLAGELSRINPQLGPSSLEIVCKESAAATSTTRRLPEKDWNLARSRKLKETFDKAAKAALALVLLLPLGCGLKTKPESELLDPRPDIPFRGAPPQAPGENPLEKLSDPDPSGKAPEPNSSGEDDEKARDSSG